MSETNMNAKAAGSADAGTSAASTATSSSTFQPRSKYRIVKDGWGSRTNFQGSHGLKMSPDDLEEGNLILEGYQECERAEWQFEQEQRALQGKQVPRLPVLSTCWHLFWPEARSDGRLHATRIAWWGFHVYIMMDPLRSILVELRPSIQWKNECVLLANISTIRFGRLVPGLASGPLQAQVRVDEEN